MEMEANRWKENIKKENQEGKWIFWHEDGNKASEGEFKEGKEEKKWVSVSQHEVRKNYGHVRVIL